MSMANIHIHIHNAMLFMWYHMHIIRHQHLATDEQSVSASANQRPVLK
jgi:hypothetical protein